jgi:hypothetical protein
MDREHVCTICLEKVMGVEYYENIMCHRECADAERLFPLRTTGTRPDVLNLHEDDSDENAG